MNVWRQASRDEKFDAALLESAERASGEVLGADFLPLWAWRAVPGAMARVGSTVDAQKVSERSVDALLTEQVQIHAWMEVSPRGESSGAHFSRHQHKR